MHLAKYANSSFSETYCYIVTLGGIGKEREEGWICTNMVRWGDVPQRQNLCRIRDWRIFLKSRVFGRRIDEAQNVRQWVNEEWTCLHGAGLGVFEETLAKRSASFDILSTKARGTSLWPKLQLWHQSVSASVVTRQPSCPFILLGVRLETTHAHLRQIASTNRSLRFTGVDFFFFFLFTI